MHHSKLSMHHFELFTHHSWQILHHSEFLVHYEPRSSLVQNIQFPFFLMQVPLYLFHLKICLTITGIPNGKGLQKNADENWAIARTKREKFFIFLFLFRFKILLQVYNSHSDVYYCSISFNLAVTHHAPPPGRRIVTRVTLILAKCRKLFAKFKFSYLIKYAFFLSRNQKNLSIFTFFN